MTPEAVIEEVKTSGLRGRGGAGFSTGMKWTFAREAKSATGKKYVICNADEGDPGAFMDRSVLEGDPHAVLEGMLICAYAVGADEGYIYVRAEYPLAIKRLQIALKQMEERNLLGDGILGTSFSFRLHIKEGAGAFVCGEETALMGSIEGKRGMPRLRPPFPAARGLWDSPTNINNVETYANVPPITPHGRRATTRRSARRRARGPRSSPLPGKIKRGGMIEVPMGISLREIIFDIGGGIQGDGKFKAVQMGGPSGGCVPGEPCRRAHRLRFPHRHRRHHGLGRHGGHGRIHLHGGRGPLLPHLHPERILRQVHLLPHRHQADAGDPHADHRGQGRGEGHRGAGGPGGKGEGLLPLRAGPDGAQPRAHDAALLPRRSTTTTSGTSAAPRRSARRSSASA